MLYPMKLEAPLKDYLWGGTRLKDEYGKKTNLDKVAESWELACHKDGKSKIVNGEAAGLFLEDWLAGQDKSVLGTNAASFSYFPLLIKLIDAKGDLSVQVHPDNDYAMRVEGEYGKTEMWYIVDCEPGASLLYGFKEKISKEEFERRIADNTLLEVCNRVPVKKGDVFFIDSGTLHAIGKGILICEIQQNSNCTYRMYDYDRRDKFGNPRELHVAKSLDVVNPVKYEKDNKCNVMLAHNEHYMSKRLVQCKYFEVIKYEIEDEAKIPVDEASFLSVIVIDGEGTIMTDDNDKELKFKAGESFFINAGKRNVVVKGRSTCIITHV